MSHTCHNLIVFWGSNSHFYFLFCLIVIYTCVPILLPNAVRSVMLLSLYSNTGVILSVFSLRISPGAPCPLFWLRLLAVCCRAVTWESQGTNWRMMIVQSGDSGGCLGYTGIYTYQSSANVRSICVFHCMQILFQKDKSINKYSTLLMAHWLKYLGGSVLMSVTLKCVQKMRWISGWMGKRMDMGIETNRIKC